MTACGTSHDCMAQVMTAYGTSRDCVRQKSQTAVYHSILCVGNLVSAYGTSNKTALCRQRRARLCRSYKDVVPALSALMVHNELTS